jgi:nicotinic acid phosphoribosyltransferase
VGGFLNIGDKLVTVPYNELQLSKNEDGEVYVQYNATEEQLEALDTFVYKDGEMTWKSQKEQRREELLAELKEQQKDLQEEQQDIAEERQDVEKVKQELQETTTPDTTKTTN